ncbi:hypothetical protein [Bradyrhizobium sp. OAE829]|uniref:hypothetical protein n=1 Tax=Bradyrhizobium sp. OAE829 TaxID=2663807 RepID=UPI00178A9177
MPFRQTNPAAVSAWSSGRRIQEVRSTDKGLYVRALVTDPVAKRCSYFGVAATIHNYMLRDVDDRERFHGLISCCTLDEVSLSRLPCNPEAKLLHRYQPSAAVEMYGIAQRWTSCLRGIVDALSVINAAKANAAPARAVETDTRPRADGTRCRPTPPRRLAFRLQRYSNF